MKTPLNPIHLCHAFLMEEDWLQDEIADMDKNPSDYNQADRVRLTFGFFITQVIRKRAERLNELEKP